MLKDKEKEGRGKEGQKSTSIQTKRTNGTIIDLIQNNNQRTKIQTRKGFGEGKRGMGWGEGEEERRRKGKGLRH
jgi:hypothetical protein